VSPGDEMRCRFLSSISKRFEEDSKESDSKKEKDKSHKHEREHKGHSNHCCH